MLRLGCSVAASALLTAATNAMAATNGGVCKKPARVVATVARGFQEFWSALEVPAKARMARHAKRIILAVSTQGDNPLLLQFTERFLKQLIEMFQQ